ncbi:MAG: hypothetical protein AB1791_06050 [Chloroflexota bacterium]
MIHRIVTLSRYFLRRLLFSLTGLIYILVGLAFWRVAFAPEQRTPDADYYVLVLGLFGAAVTFLVTLSVATRAYQAVNDTLLVRLPSRVEYLTAVLVSALLFATGLQGLIALLARWNGPGIALGQALQIPPIWLSINILAGVLALHASDLVTAGWSRVYVFGLLALFLFGQDANGPISRAMAGLANRLSSLFFRQGWVEPATQLNNFASWSANSGAQVIEQVFGFIFWPFRAIANAIIGGRFDRIQALAPAVLLLYATILFMLAANFFATKDLFLTE